MNGSKQKFDSDLLDVLPTKMKSIIIVGGFVMSTALCAAILQSCGKKGTDTPTPVVLPPIKEVLKTPTVGFTVTNNPDGSVSIANTTTDATEYVWTIKDGDKDTTIISKDLTNVPVDLKNPYHSRGGIDLSGAEHPGGLNTAANGSYEVKLTAYNKKDQLDTQSATKTQTIDIKEGIDLKLQEPFKINHFDEVGIRYDGYDYKRLDGKMQSIVTKWKLAPDYDKIRNMTVAELRAAGHSFGADFLDLLVNQIIRDKISSISKLATFADIEKYVNKIAKTPDGDEVMIDMRQTGVAFVPTAETGIGGFTKNNRVNVKGYLNVDLANFITTAEGTDYVTEWAKSQTNFAKKTQGIPKEFVGEGWYGVLSLDGGVILKSGSNEKNYGFGSGARASKFEPSTNEIKNKIQ